MLIGAGARRILARELASAVAGTTRNAMSATTYAVPAAAAHMPVVRSARVPAGASQRIAAAILTLPTIRHTGTTRVTRGQRSTNCGVKSAVNSSGRINQPQLAPTILKFQINTADIAAPIVVAITVARAAAAWRP